MPKTRVGRVVSDTMDKTRVVAVERAFRHPRYERVVKRTTRFSSWSATFSETS